MKCGGVELPEKYQIINAKFWEDDDCIDCFFSANCPICNAHNRHFCHVNSVLAHEHCGHFITSMFEKFYFVTEGK